jgi:hypothetical protein
MTVEELKAEIAALEANARGRRFSPAEKRDWNAWNEELAEREARTNRVLELGGNPNGVVAGADFSVPGARRRVQQTGPGSEYRDAALRAIERHEGALTARANDRLADGSSATCSPSTAATSPRSAASTTGARSRSASSGVRAQ